MRAMKTNTLVRQLRRVATIAAVSLLANAAQAAAPGITGTSFALDAAAAYITQPDGSTVYSWGYGCTTPAAAGTFRPTTIAGGNCPTMQLPGPTLIVTQGQTVTVTLTNNLPTRAGATSILFPGFTVTAAGGSPGLLTREAAAGSPVTYSFVASNAGTHSYYSGTQSDLQIEMGLYGAIIVLPSSPPGVCTAGLPATRPGGNALARTNSGEVNFRLADAAFNHNDRCYDREYLFQFSEIDPRIHRAAEEIVNCTGTRCPGNMDTVATEPYLPAYYMINGRSMPDDMDPNYTIQYPHQPYNGNPHRHPGELTLLRIIGQGRWQHPFHEHGNHVRALARDGNLILTPPDSSGSTGLAGPLLFTTTTTPGLAMDGIFYWTGKGLNWDAYGHNPTSGDSSATLACTPDANGYNTGAPTAINYFEWCQDH